jgi:hypothetical protein
MHVLTIVHTREKKKNPNSEIIFTMMTSYQEKESEAFFTQPEQSEYLSQLSPLDP